MADEFDSARDTITEVAESAAAHAGRIAVIIAGAVRDIAREVVDWVGEVVEAGESARRGADEPEVVVDVEPVERPGTAGS
ncbi:hypothetical protein [Actinokineospora globicatena]|nr:hypothetical protein [Actinokineospora globicatena]MCP2305356.1 hypothetical protein [Actinokineospora globicatena]